MKKNIAIIFVAIAALAFTITAFTKHNKTAATVGFNHLALYVYDLKTSTDFYEKLIGLQKIEEPFHDGRHTWFKLTEHGHLHIISGNKKDQPHIKDTHICFSVPSVEDFIKKLNAEKIPFESWKGEKQQFTLRVDGVKQVYFQDPDGFWVEVNDAKD